MEWANNLQKAVMTEWLEGIEKDSSPEAKRKLKLEIGKKYDITMGMVSGIVQLMATEGLKKVHKKGGGKREGKTFEPFNYHELVKGLKERVEALERRFKQVVEGIENVLEDGQTFAIHLQQLQKIGRRVGMQRREIDAIDLQSRRTGTGGG